MIDNNNKLSLNLMIDILNEKLKKGLICDWRINGATKERINIYCEKNFKIESVLNSKREDFFITVYKDFGDNIGDSLFSIHLSDSKDNFKKELEDAIFICSQSLKKKFELPFKDDEITSDSHIDYDIFYSKQFLNDFKNSALEEFVEDKINIFRKTIEKAQEDEIEVKLNLFEFFNSIVKSMIYTSKGIEKSYNKTSSFMEFILTARNTESGRENEHVIYENINNIYDYDFESFFEENIVYAKDSVKTVKPNDFEGKVLLCNSACIDFWRPSSATNSIIGHCSARFKHMGISKFDIGQVAVKSNDDKISVYFNPLIEQNGASVPYDALGISAKRLCLIKNSVFNSFFATKQYADYLGIKPTGPSGVIEVEGGKDSYESFKSSDKYIEIHSFAWFVPDLVSGDFSAEVRLGYIVDDGVKTPFSGGLFSGNVFKVVEDVKLSSEIVNVSGYFGPKVMMFKKGKIVGVVD